MSETISPQALALTPLLVERIWGTETLDPWYPQPQAGKPIGEVWLTAEQCTVEGSSTTLADVANQYPAAFGNASGDGFPLLIKLLYPREKLSVQVHPNDAQAQVSLNQPRGKTECWYVLSAQPGAQVAVGFRKSASIDSVQQAIQDGSLEDMLRMIPVKAGDMVFVEAGTVHAIGPGMVVLETQQYSDVTYRLWDYGRPRELHIEAGLTVTRTETRSGLVQPVSFAGFDRLIECAYFTVDRFRPAAGSPVPLDSPDNMQVVVALGPGASLSMPGDSINLPPGCAVVLPASGDAHRLHATEMVEVIRVIAPSKTI